MKRLPRGQILRPVLGVAHQGREGEGVEGAVGQDQQALARGDPIRHLPE